MVAPGSALINAALSAKGSKPPKWAYGRIRPHNTAVPMLWAKCISAGVLWEGAGSPKDLANGKTPTPYSAAPTWHGGTHGKFLRFNDSSRNKETFLLSHLNGAFDGLTDGLTFLVFAKFIGTNSGDEDTLMGQWSTLQDSSDVNATRMYFRYDSLNNELDIQTASAGSFFTHTVSRSIEDSLPHVLVARWNGSNLSTWVDGVQQGSTTTFSGPMRSASNSKVPELMGGHNVSISSGGSDSPRFELYSWGIWTRGLRDAEIRMLGRDPFIMFRPRLDSALSMLIDVPDAGGGNAIGTGLTGGILLQRPRLVA